MHLLNTKSKFRSIASWEFFQGTCYLTHYAPNAKAQLTYFALSVVPFNLRVLLCNAVPDSRGYKKIAIRKRKFIRLYDMIAMNLLVPLVIADSGRTPKFLSTFFSNRPTERRRK